MEFKTVLGDVRRNEGEQMAKIIWRTFVRGVHKQLGLDSPYSSQEYGINWSKQRRKCLERDDLTCRVCRTTSEELDRELSVHHITPRSHFDGTPREMNALENLITLCPECHGRFEGCFVDSSPDRFAEKARREWKNG